MNLVAKIEWKLTKMIGKFLYKTDKTGHSRLCRLLHTFGHYGPHGTFVHMDRHSLEHGGNLCSFGVQCGSPAASHMRHMNEVSEHFHMMTKMLEKSGALVSGIWENPRFSAVSLCNCGSAEIQNVNEHSPLCPYREKWGVRPTFEEYRQLQNTVSH